MHKACVLPCQCHLACAGGHRHFKIKTLMMMIWWSIKQQTTAKLLASPRHSEAHFVFLLLPHSHPRLSSHHHHHHPLTHRHLSPSRSQVSVKLTAKTKTVWGFCTADKETKAKGRESVYCKSVLLRSLENATVGWSTRLCWLYKTVVVVSHFSFTFAMTDWFFDCLLLCVLTSFPVPVTLTNKKRSEIIKKH